MCSGVHGRLQDKGDGATHEARRVDAAPHRADAPGAVRRQNDFVTDIHTRYKSITSLGSTISPILGQYWQSAPR